MASRHSRSRKRSRAINRVLVRLVLIGAVAGFAYFNKDKLTKWGGGVTSRSPSSAVSADAPKVRGYDKLENCRLVDHRNNDGDSFFVRSGRSEFELRLYYVDSAEKYLSDRFEKQRERVADQAKDFGVSVNEAVELGQKAKAHTLSQLKGKSFTVYTKWEEVFDGERYYGFVELPDRQGVYLSQSLVENGLARLHTKGEPTPDGRTYRQYRDDLNQAERAAKRARRGAWGY